MKKIINCPKCNAPLLNGVLSLRNGAEAWKQVCDKKIDHSFIYLTKEGKEDDIISMGMTLDHLKVLKVFFDFKRYKIFVHKGDSLIIPFPGPGLVEIPWFEPNIDEYDKLSDKIKKYILFV